MLHWLAPAHRQVRAAGPVEPVSQDEADQYWAARAPVARLTAAASRRSRVIASWAALETQVRDMARDHPDGAGIARLPRWGGFRLLPSRVEFWQESPDGLHDRIRYPRRQTAGSPNGSHREQPTTSTTQGPPHTAAQCPGALVSGDRL